MAQEMEFKVGDQVVYPSHGVGQITDKESQSIGGFEIEVFVISFPKDKMVLRVPVKKAASSGVRPLMDKSCVEDIYKILRSKPKQGNRMWSRRAQEYEAKINSGDLTSVAEVVRDLYKNVDTDRSYSERSIYEDALNRVATELALLEDEDQTVTMAKLTELLKEKSAA